MHPFSTPWKHQGKTCFQGIEKGGIGNEWVKGRKMKSEGIGWQVSGQEKK